MFMLMPSYSMHREQSLQLLLFLLLFNLHRFLLLGDLLLELFRQVFKHVMHLAQSLGLRVLLLLELPLFYLDAQLLQFYLEHLGCEELPLLVIVCLLLVHSV